MRSRYSKRSAGTTLVEVLCALFLLGTILVSMVVARGRLVEQIARADEELEVLRAVDALIGAWWETPGGVPVGDDGALEGHEGFRWRTRQVPCPEIEELLAQKVRVEILKPGRLVPGRLEPGRRGETKIVTAVDIVLPGGRRREGAP